MYKALGYPDNLDDSFRTFTGTLVPFYLASPHARSPYRSPPPPGRPLRRPFWSRFTVPGMGHCSGGPGPNAYGGPGQRQDVLGGTGQSLTFDKEHDMVLAMIDWVENGNAPDQIVAVKYNNNKKTNGVAFTRPLCPSVPLFVFAPIVLCSRFTHL